MRKILILIVIIAFAFTSCYYEYDANDRDAYIEPQQEMEVIAQASAVESFCIPYDATAELSPFNNKSRINNSIIGLIYDGLFKSGRNMDPENSICQDFEYDGKEYLLRLRDDIYFHDGSKLTSADVVYSLNIYRESELYSEKLSNISKVSTDGEYKVKILLKVPNSGMDRILTMPIVKSGSARDSNPTGSGRYIPDSGGDSYLLSANDRWYGGGKQFGSIELYPVNSMDMLLYGMTVGNFSIAEATKLSPGIEYRGSYYAESFPTLSMHYLGFNCSAAPLNNAAVRRAVSLIVNREELCSLTYGGYADPSEFPIHPASKEYPKDLSNRDGTAGQLLEGAGLILNTNGIFEYKLNSKYTQFAVTILVNSDNNSKTQAAEQIAQSLRAAGIAAECEAVPFDEFTERLNKGEFTIYLAETILYPDFGHMQLIESRGALNFGYTDAEGRRNLINAWDNVNNASIENRAQSILQYAQVFSLETPFVPLCFERGMVISKLKLPDNFCAVNGDIFYNITEW